VFNNVIRPRFASQHQRSVFQLAHHRDQYSLDLPLSNTDSLGITYTLSRTTTSYPLSSAVNVPGVTVGDVQSKISSRSLGVGWARDTGNERVLFSNSVSGGWLGGGENMGPHLGRI